MRSVQQLTSDTDVRRWVGAHDPEAIAEVATDQKIRLAGRLLDGWVSAEDLEAVQKICASVKSSEESAQIRTVIEPRVSSLNDRQAAQLRSFLSAMP